MIAAVVAIGLFVALLPLGIGLLIALRPQESVEQTAQRGRQQLGRVGHGR